MTLHIKYYFIIKRIFGLLILICSSVQSFGQVKSLVDTTSIKIGEELFFYIEVETDTTSTVVFPEGQTFQPMELLESYTTDTTQNDLKIKLIKKYGLTQFDSGSYTVPKQKVLINEKLFYSDSIVIRVNAVKVDTTKQKLFEIKPIIEVNNPPSFWNSFWRMLILVFVVTLFLFLYIFIWRKSPHRDNQTVLVLPPYEQAKKALKNLDEKKYYKEKKVKHFYSELTFVLRQYLNEKVYNRSLESTTDELLAALHHLKESKQFTFGNETLKNIESTLKRADLVKFAKSEPEFEIIRSDKNLINNEIDQIKKGLPEPTEEELKKTQEYQQELQKKRKQKRIKIVGLSFAGLLFLTFVGCSIYFGFTRVKDTLLRHPSKLLLETEKWVTSEYGAPGIYVDTPKVLGRITQDSLIQSTSNITTKVFGYSENDIPLKIILKSSKLKTTNDGNSPSPNEPVDLIEVAEKELAELEKLGASNMLPKNEQFITPNGQEGLKTSGRANFPFEGTDAVDAEFVILGFSNTDLLQQIILIWDLDDQYVAQIAERILNSVELIKSTQE